jgi:hypothetical protein
MIHSGLTLGTPSHSTFRGEGVGLIESAFLNSSHNTVTNYGAVGSFIKSNGAGATINYSTFFNDTATNEEALYLANGENFSFAHSNFYGLTAKGEIVEASDAKATFEECYFADNTADSLIYVTASSRPATFADCFISHPNMKTTAYITFKNTVTTGFTSYDISEPCFPTPTQSASASATPSQSVSAVHTAPFNRRRKANIFLSLH